MTNTTNNFDPIPRLQQIAATIEESGADIFDAPATAVHYIKCAIKEIERLRKERDEARQEVCELLCNPPERLVKGICALPEECADIRQWDCFKENTNG